MLLASLYAEAQKSILLKCGKLLDTKTGIVLEKQFVLLSGNKVVAVGPTAFKADTTIDLSDYFVMLCFHFNYICCRYRWGIFAH
jgi:imidazolonepropionase-like amidohydrolase